MRGASMRRTAAGALALAAVVVSACGGGEGAVTGVASATRTTPTLSTGERTVPAGTTGDGGTAVTVTETAPPQTVTVTETAPPQTVTTATPADTVTAAAPAETVTVTETTTETQSVTVTEPQPATTTDDVNAAAAAAAGAAVASQDEDSIEWGWIAFAVLAAANLIGGVVWWLRRRSRASGPGGPAPATSA